MKKICLGMAVLTLSLGLGQRVLAQQMIATAQQTVMTAPQTMTISQHRMTVSMGGVSAPQVKDDLFAGTEKFAQGATDVTEVNLDKSMLGMVGHGNSELAHKLDFIVVHNYEYDKPGMYRMEDVEVYRKRLIDNNWNCFIHTRDRDETTDLCSRSLPDKETNELVIITAEPKELSFIHLRGKMSVQDLRKVHGIPSIVGNAVSGSGSSSSSSKNKSKDKDKYE